MVVLDVPLVAAPATSTLYVRRVFTPWIALSAATPPYATTRMRVGRVARTAAYLGYCEATRASG